MLNQTQNLQISIRRPQILNTNRRRQNLKLVEPPKPLGGLGFIEESEQSQEDAQESIVRVADYFTNEEIKESNELTSKYVGNESSLISAEAPKLNMFQIKAAGVSQADKPSWMIGSLSKANRSMGRPNEVQQPFLKLQPVAIEEPPTQS